MFFKEFPSFGAATLNARSANETVFVLGTFSEQLIRGSQGSRYLISQLTLTESTTEVCYIVLNSSLVLKAVPLVTREKKPLARRVHQTTHCLQNLELVTTYKALNGLASGYITNLIDRCPLKQGNRSVVFNRSQNIIMNSKQGCFRAVKTLISRLIGFTQVVSFNIVGN